jgi:hypothetical protein
VTVATPTPRAIKIVRWTARIWSIVVTVGILLILLSPESLNAGPIAPEDIFLLSLTGVALIGLFIAWRWELVGGTFTIVMLFIREIAFLIIKGYWLIGFLFLWFFIATPAILFLIAWNLERKAMVNSFDKVG